MDTKDYRKEPDYTLYEDAITFGEAEVRRCGPLSDRSPVQSMLWWAAWYAARRTAGALLHEARDLGLSEEQLEKLRVVAARVATD